MDRSLKKSLTSQEKWLRFLFMIFFFVVNYFVQILIGFIALLQFVCTLFKDEPNPRILHFGDGLSQFVYQIMAYLTYTTEEKPFPFNEWPASNDAPVRQKTKKSKGKE